MENRAYTLFIDIDGTLIPHEGDVTKQPFVNTVLENTLEKLVSWDRKGHNIILTTGRRESTRNQTEKQLLDLGIFYDQLIMGIGGGKRILINDRKPNSDDDTAMAINITRNKGIKDINL